MNFKSFFLKFWQVIKNSKPVERYIFVLFLIGFLLRIYRLDANLVFAFDQGRDAQVVEDMLSTWKPVLIGPTTGLAGVFLGPLLYYLLLPFYLIGGGDPVWAAYGFAFLTSLGIIIFYLLGKNLWNEYVGAVAATLLAFSNYGIHFSRWLSNPTPILLIAPLLFLSVYLAGKGKTPFALLSAFLAGLILQTELANGFFLALVALGYLLLHIRQFSFKVILAMGFCFILTFSPQIFFDLRHEQIISKAVMNSFFFDQNKSSLEHIWVVGQRREFILQWLINGVGFSGSFVYGHLFPYFWRFFMGLIILPLILSLFFKKFKSTLLIVAWLLVPSMYYVYYVGNYGFFFDYYMISLFLPVLFLLSILLYSLSKYIPYGHNLVVVLITLYAVLNLSHSEILIHPDEFRFSLLRQKESVAYILKNYKADESVHIRNPDGSIATYQYLLDWQAKRDSLPKVNYLDTTKRFYVLYEPDMTDEYGKIVPRQRFLEWHNGVIGTDSKLIEKRNFGIIIVETYERI